MYLQRELRMNKIGIVDKKETYKLSSRIERQKYTVKRQPSKQVETVTNKPEDSCEDESVEDDDQYLPFSSTEKLPWQMRVKLKAKSLHCDRYGVSERAAAAIASSVLEDIGLITDTEASNVIDRYKIRRERYRSRKSLQANQLNTDQLHGIYFDGRKDDTMVIERIESKQFRRTIKEEHYSIIKEPGSVYLGYVSPNSDSSKDIVTSITARLAEQGVSLEYLDVIGCDGTNTNTGWKGGAIRQLEVYLGRPLQWAVCLLHFIAISLIYWMVKQLALDYSVDPLERVLMAEKVYL